MLDIQHVLVTTMISQFSPTKFRKTKLKYENPIQLSTEQALWCNLGNISYSLNKSVALSLTI